MRMSKKLRTDLYEDFKLMYFGTGQFDDAIKTQPAQAGATTASSTSYDLARITTGPNRQQDTKTTDSSNTQTLTSNLRFANEFWSSAPGWNPSFTDPSYEDFNFGVHLQIHPSSTSDGASAMTLLQAGDLHGACIESDTSLSVPLSAIEGSTHSGHNLHPDIAPITFPPQMQHHFSSQQYHYQDTGHFQRPQLQARFQQETFASRRLAYQPNLGQGCAEDSTIGDIDPNLNTADPSLHQAPDLVGHSRSFNKSVSGLSRPPTSEMFRFHTTLDAPTAMTEHPDDAPITYLNKGQTYALKVVDTNVHQPTTPLKYCTFVRISFEDELQRQRPAAFWQLWKERRDIGEAHRGGSQLRAIEYVNPFSMSSKKDLDWSHVKLQSASFDGFCVIWSPPAGTSSCSFAVRFNFLSTDFHGSRGAKAIPLRFCATTEICGRPWSDTKGSVRHEVCFCKVKLFRDHGAERKLSNDYAQVRKTFDKIEQQIGEEQFTTGRNTSRKRRGSSIAKAGSLDKPRKAARYRKIPPTDSEFATIDYTRAAQDDLQMKLITLQDTLNSSKPTSVLGIRGAEEDGSYLHSAETPSEGDQDEARLPDDPACNERMSLNVETPFLVSEYLREELTREKSGNPTIPAFKPDASHAKPDECLSKPQTGTRYIKVAKSRYFANPPDTQAVVVGSPAPDNLTESRSVESIRIDQSYPCTTERASKPVACVYIRFSNSNSHSLEKYYRAVYLKSFTYKDFLNAVAKKCNIEPASITRTVYVSCKGTQVLFDDDCVRGLLEGQTMTAEILKAPESPGMVSRLGTNMDLRCKGDSTTAHTTAILGCELRLFF